MQLFMKDIKLSQENIAPVRVDTYKSQSVNFLENILI